jgi:hypothetical protein
MVTRILPRSSLFALWSWTAWPSWASVMEAVADQCGAQVLARGSVEEEEKTPLLEDDLLLDAAVVDHERAGFLRAGEPLEELGELHRLEVAGDPHGARGILREIERSQRAAVVPVWPW